MKQLILIGLILLLLPLIACGSPSEEQESPQSTKVTVDCAEVLVANQYLLKKQEGLEAETKRLRGREGEFTVAVRTLEDANLALGIEIALLKALDNREDYERVLNELAQLKAEKKDWKNLSELKYKRILDQYNELNALYPLKNFPDKATLVDWRFEAGNITDDRPLWVLQQLARDEGYLVVIGYNIPYGMVIVGDYWYKITTDDKKLVEKLGKVE